MKNKFKCEVCNKKLTNQDGYKLCCKCHPAWRKGFIAGKEMMKSYILQGINEAEK